MLAHALGWSAFEGLDELRGAQGLACDALGLGAVKSRCDTVFSEPGARLARYRGGRAAGPSLVLVPAPIKRPDIFDLAPEVSVVQRCLRYGARVHLIEWRGARPDFGLAEFADRLILDCLRAVGGEPPILLAHSLGGLLAAIFAALHPGRVRAVVLIATPLHFGPDAGIFGRMFGAIDLSTLPRLVPGSFISATSLEAAPDIFAGERWLDWVRSLPDEQLLRNHLRVERWTLGESAVPRRLFAELVQLIGREDRFVRGTLRVAGRAAMPSRISAPLLAVVDSRCRIVPLQAVRPFLLAATGAETAVYEYQREAGVGLQHVGPLVGRRAHVELWPRILGWIAAHWRARPAGGATRP